MKKTILCLGLFAALFACGCQTPSVLKSTAGKKLFWDFEMDAVGSLPAGWVATQSDHKIPSAAWQVTDDSWGNTLAMTSSACTGNTCNLLLSSMSSIANLTLSVKIRAIGQRDNQNFGLAWRALDGDNFYFALWNPKEKMLRMGYFQGGHMTPLRSISVGADPTQWHTLQIEQFRDNIWVSMDNVVQMELKDDTIRYPGMIGLVTQADSWAMFDDVRVTELVNLTVTPN
jgi:hypothetical protein